MASLREIKDHIASVRSTLKITSAMKLVSSAKLRKAQQTIEGMRPYSEALSEILAAACGDGAGVPCEVIAPRGCNGRGPSSDGRGPRSGRSEDGDVSPAGKLVADFLLKNNRVRINDGAIYGGPEGCRINLACPEATMKEGLRRIAEGLSELLK